MSPKSMKHLKKLSTIGQIEMDFLAQLALRSDTQAVADDEHAPDGHPKLLHLWPVKLLQAGRSDYDDSGVMAMRAAASFSR